MKYGIECEGVLRGTPTLFIGQHEQAVLYKYFLSREKRGNVHTPRQLQDVNLPTKLSDDLTEYFGRFSKANLSMGAVYISTLDFGTESSIYVHIPLIEILLSKGYRITIEFGNQVLSRIDMKNILALVAHTNQILGVILNITNAPFLLEYLPLLLPHDQIKIDMGTYTYMVPASAFIQNARADILNDTLLG